MTNDDVRGIARTYFEAWQAGDAEALRGILADDVTFAGPMGVREGAKPCVDGLLGMRAMMQRIDIAVMVADESDVLTWYDLVTEAGALPTVNWSHVEDGRITAIRATFDPRPLLS